MTLHLFEPPIIKHKLTKNQFQQEPYPSSGASQKQPKRKQPSQKYPTPKHPESTKPNIPKFPRLKQRYQLSK